MEDITRFLSQTIGPRPAGSENEHRASQYIAQTMTSLSLAVETRPFYFLGWEPTRPATVQLLAPENRQVAAGSFLFSGSAPEGGMEGRVEHVGTMYLCRDFFEWPKYAVKAADGSDLGYLVANAGGRAITFVLYELGRLFGRMPYVVVDLPTHDYFQKQLAAGREVRVRMDTAGVVTDGLLSHNVMGVLLGTCLPDEEIVVCAHYDSTLDSPGACDNASGMDAMLRVAETLVQGPKLAKTVRFIAFGAEEYLMFGSKFHVATLKEKGLLDRVKNVINLDMVGFGDHLAVTVAPESFKRRLQSVFAGLTDAVRVEYDSAVLPVSDHYPFYEEGIPVAMFLGWPYDDYHQTTDSYDKIDLDMIRRTAEAATEVVRQMAGR
jgi:aminopeptidase YwaD